VAINKIDKPDANLDRVKKQLSEHDLMPEEWGGKTVTCQISAKEAKGIDELLEMILLMSDILELKADPHSPASGVVIESKLDKGRGPVATILIKSGTLRIGNSFSIGSTYGRVRALVDDHGKNLKEAGPATPVEVLGCSEVPQPGDLLSVSDSDKQARSAAMQRKDEIKQKAFGGARISLESFSKHMKEGEKSDLNLIIKSDVQGSLEALIGSLSKLSVEDKKVRIIHGGAGNINESDIMLAEASQAIVIGFHVNYEGDSKSVAEREGVDVKIYEVIYNVVDDIKMALEGMLEPEYEEVVVGNAEVRAVYKYSKVGTIAGCFVNQGKFTRGGMIRIKRNGEQVHEGRLESLKRFKEDVKSVEKGYECGIALMGYQNFRVGDQIEAYETRKKPRKKSAK
jgi:translation initiation factor IF-2